MWLMLARYLFKPITALLKNREQDIKETYANADAAKAAADQMKSDLEARFAEIESAARARIQSSVKEAQMAKDEIMADARSKSEDIIRRGQADLAREREKTLAEMRESVVNISLSAAGALIGESLDETRHRKLVTDFIDRIGTAK